MVITHTTVYPRVCGGSRPSCVPGRVARGLSPRVRGKQVGRRTRAGGSRSIPACAGEARFTNREAAVKQVYPRVCGGSREYSTGRSRSLGLSPRVRGKPVGLSRLLAYGRSIPACAGEAGNDHPCEAPNPVYPRVCGGSHLSRSSRQISCGLSPRVRGKPQPQGWGWRLRRSIPACAGEAWERKRKTVSGKVYPRVCGGSLSASGAYNLADGLSPRVRGKLGAGCRQDYMFRSIPACAGEAGAETGGVPLGAVYPRVCGGSDAKSTEGAGGDGLSPRVRGKLAGGMRRRVGVGSIPACAGEASAAAEHRHHQEVYPRVCGGSRINRRLRLLHQGLSPRVRGKPHPAICRCAGARSIPSCAGEAAAPSTTPG